MKVTFLSYIYPYPERGYNPGIERVVEEFAKELVEQGHEVHVVTTYRNGGNKRFDVAEGVLLHRVPDARHYLGKGGSIFSVDLLSLNYSFTEYSRLLESSDIVHTFTPIVWKPFSTPLVAHYHHWDDPDEFIDYLHLPTNHHLWMSCYDLADRIVAVSNYSADDLASRGVNREKIDVVPNGVDTDKFSPGPSPVTYEDWETVLLYVGPLTERKGLQYLIRAMPSLLREHPDTGLVIVGGGDQDKLKQLAKEFDVHDNLRFEGFVPDDDLPDYYRAADIFVFPSLLEGFGMVLIEAMACGLPVVSTTATAIPEVVGDAGVLVPPSDEAALAASVSNIIKSDEIDFWSAQSLERVQSNFSWSETTYILYTLYSEIQSI